MFTPYRSETRGIVERAVRGVKEGTSAFMAECDLAEAMGYCGYLRNIQDEVADGKAVSQYERELKDPFGAQFSHSEQKYITIRSPRETSFMSINMVFK